MRPLFGEDKVGVGASCPPGQEGETLEVKVKARDGSPGLRNPSAKPRVWGVDLRAPLDFLTSQRPALDFPSSPTSSTLQRQI